ncbi:FAD-dependent oxidoreductase [Streptomyces triticirhizae]|uniref:FAD-dependent oxidoreductase n=1 Tax=Streptomyces triticirhizae TaxID=2483353 RepID=A0A3M2LLL7_9ACTN|nr:FAD-dependent oxidoreductase [Streptomyces triticirhizae]RMI38329.1 FAD-dependent oxidoreductase [Streptomyces triticirhizae]
MNEALPVWGEADVAVVGGSLAGVAAAVAQARAGRRVLLTDPGFALGAELTAANRPWVTAGSVPEPLAGLVGDHVPAGTPVPLRPAAVKLALEDAVLSAGGQLLYGVRWLGTTLDGAVFAGKSGRGVVRCGGLLNAGRGPREGRVWSVEFTGVGGAAAGLSGTHGLAGPGGVRLVDGCRGPGHVYALVNVAEGNRRAALVEATRPLREHPGFAGAEVGAVGTVPLAGGAVPAWAQREDGVWELGGGAAAVDGDDLVDAGELWSVGSLPPAHPSPPPAAPACPSVARTLRTDVLVVGGGTSGASAALGAARAGAETVLVEAGPGPGGTGTHGGVHSYWFGRRAGHAAEIQRLTRETHRALGLRHGGVGRWNIEAKSLALHRALRRAGVQLHYEAQAFDVIKDGDRVVGAVFADAEGHTFAVRARVVVDATGDADLAAWAGAPCAYGAADTHTVMWSALARFDTPSSTVNSFGGLADHTDVQDTTRAVLAARRRAPGAHDHAALPVARETRHLAGQVTLTLTDQLIGRRWPDAVTVHFSNHDLKGKGEALWPQLGLIPPNLEIDVPYRALLPRNVTGLLVTGKAISATHDALPALRMQADLENLGEVTGLAAARCAAGDVPPHRLDVAALQAELERRGRLPARRPAPRVPPTPALVEELGRRLPLHSYSDMGRREVFRGVIPFVHLALDQRPATTEALTAALDRATGQLRTVLAQLLVLHGQRAGADVLVAELTETLAGPALPPRTSAIREAQLPPDQSAMPDPCYLLHTLALARDPRAIPLWERVAALLDAEEAAFRDPAAAPFSWVDAVCAGAERLGDPAAVPALTALRDRPALHGQWRTGGVEPDDLQERRALLELAIARALAACGSPRGHRTLVAYLADNRALLAAQAHTRLTLLTGVDHGADRAAWLAHLAREDPPAPRPLPSAHDPHRHDTPALIPSRDPAQGALP